MSVCGGTNSCKHAAQAKRVKILLVDDSAKVREMIKSLLAGLGVEGATHVIGNKTSFCEALAAYRAGQPDWVLMDILMPTMDGLTATRQITAACPQARVVVLTQFESEQLRAAAHDAGAYAYVLKENVLQVRQLIEAQAGVHIVSANQQKTGD